MLETELQFAPSRDRFYSAMASDCCYHSHQRQIPKGKVVIPENPSTESRREPAEQPSTAFAAPSSNLDRFLKSTTLSVPSKYLCETKMWGSRKCDAEFEPYFTLGDLWESFTERSAYGAAVPLVLNDRDCVVQYYVPFLSGIQLYTESVGTNDHSSNKHSNQIGNHQPEQDALGKGSDSDGISDSKLGRGFKYLREQFNCHHPAAEAICKIDRLSLRENGFDIQEDFSSDDGEAGNSQRHLLFEFLERDMPCIRAPLADKILDLSNHFPELKTLRSCDLLPDSWMSVAWYPIYRIPTGPMLKDLDAHFLTFHSLSTTRRDASNVPAPTVTSYDGNDNSPILSLPILGLASYKFGGSTWTPEGGCEKQVAHALLESADNWLRSLNVTHPDFQFFTSHRPRTR